MTLLADLEVRRLREHRLDPSAPLTTVDEVLAFVETIRVIMTSGKSSLPSLTEAMVGGQIRGSWMTHPECNRIYDLWGEAAKSPRVWEAPLVQGKSVIVTAGLRPAIASIAGDADRVASAVDGLKPLERRLYDDVVKTGEVRMDEWTQINQLKSSSARTARARLAALFLVDCQELHTDRGYHTVIVRAAQHAKPTMSFRQATREVLLAALRACVVADAKEVRKWNDWSSDALDELLDDGTVVTVDAAQTLVVCADLTTRPSDP